MTRRILTLLLALALVIGLAACTPAAGTTATTAGTTGKTAGTTTAAATTAQISSLNPPCSITLRAIVPLWAKRSLAHFYRSSKQQTLMTRLRL